jgi:hypothetical protein
MPRKSGRKPTVESPLHSKQQQLAQREAQLKAQLSKAQEFLVKVPALKDEARKKQQREIVDRFNRPARLEGPVDFRLELLAARSAKPAKKLRKERTYAPLLTLALLAIFVTVAYWAWKSIWQG